MHDLSPLASGQPRQITPTTPADYFEVLTRAVFNSGMSWQAVESRWRAIAEAFAGFEPQVVAGYGEQDVERLATDERLIRNRGKIAAVPANARTFVELADGHDGFDVWLTGMGDYDARERALRSRFRYIGEFGAFWSQYTLCLPVPDYREWARSRGRSVPAYLTEA
ncbi:hypothetical protein BH23ACT10_BH23ACT10_01660 [soil metagenome]